MLTGIFYWFVAWVVWKVWFKKKKKIVVKSYLEESKPGLKIIKGGKNE